MRFSRRPASLGLTAVMAVTMIGVASPAQARSCTAVPGSVTGTDVTILGDRYRVPWISNIQVCTDGASAPLVGVETSGNGYCSTTCLSVLLRGDDADAGAVTISYREDGTTRSQTLNPGGVGGGSDTCLFSIGSPEAPYPWCTIALGPDELPDVNDLLPDDLPGLDDLPDPPPLNDPLRGLPGCENVPDVYDSQGGSANFCDDPRGWVQLVAGELRTFCDGRCHPVYLICQLTSEEPWNC